MNCKACRIEIEESETSGALSSEARVHAETCLPCRAVRDEHLALRRLVGSLETVAAPPDFDLRLRARLAAADVENHHRPAWLRLAPGGVSLVGVAVSLVLIILAAVAYQRVRMNAPDTMRPSEVAVNKGTVNVADPNAGRGVAMPNSNHPEETSATGNETKAQNHFSEAPIATVGGTSSNNSSRVLRNRMLSPAAMRDVTAPASDNQKIISSDSAVYNPPPLITPTNIYNPAVDPVPYIVLPVRASAQPMTFFLKGWDGASRPVPLKTVTFGSEKLFEQNADTRADASDTSDIW